MSPFNHSSVDKRGTVGTILTLAGLVLACLLLASAAQASIMGVIMGMQPANVLCKNETTGQTVTANWTDESWDCGVLGLIVSPGDFVVTGVRGVAVPYDEAPISNMGIIEHPQVSTVLVVTWNQDFPTRAGWLEFTINGGPPLTSPERERAAGPQREIVLGAPADAVVNVRIANRFPEGVVRSEPMTAMTGSLPEGIDDPTLNAFDPSLALDADYLLTSLNTNGERNGYALILNRAGRIVWYQEPVRGLTLLVPRVARAGNHLILDKDPYWSGSDETATLRKMTIEHEVIKEIPVPYLHHGWDERSDGSIVWGANKSGFDHEQLWTVDPQGNYRMIWDSDTWDVPGLVASNTTVWEESTDTVLLTFWTNSTTVEVDFETGEIVRQFGDEDGSWAFLPEDSQFWFAHGNHYTDEHTLLVSSHLLPGQGQEQRIREYALHEESQTLVQIWEYGEGEGLYAPTWGEATRLENGNTLLNTGSDPLIREVTMAGETAWEVNWTGFSTVGHMTFIEGLHDLYALDGR